MLAAPSTGGRRLVCALGRGDELVEALRALCVDHEVRTAEIRGAGILEEVQLASYDPLSQMWLGARPVVGPLELLSLWGSVSEESGQTAIRIHASMAPCAAAAEAPRPALGGQLASARVFSVELVIECFDDLILRRHRDAATGLAPWKEAIGLGRPAELPDHPTETLERIDPARAAVPVPGRREVVAPRPAPEPSPPRYPADSPMAAFSGPPSGRIAPGEPDLLPEQPPPQQGDGVPPRLIPGDLIDHPRLGRCVVDALEDDGEVARLRLRSGRVVRLDLDALNLSRRPGTTAPRIFDAQTTSR